MKLHLPITAAVLVPLLALGPACATAPQRQIRLAFIDGSSGASEEDEGIVEPMPAEPLELSDAELAQGFRTLAQDPQLIALFRQPEGTGLHLLPASYVLGSRYSAMSSLKCRLLRLSVAYTSSRDPASDLTNPGRPMEIAGRLGTVRYCKASTRHASKDAERGEVPGRLGVPPRRWDAREALQVSGSAVSGSLWPLL